MSGSGRGGDATSGIAFRMAVRASCLKHKKYRVWDKEFILAIDKVRAKSTTLIMHTIRGDFTVEVGEGYHSGKGKPYRVLFLENVIRGMELSEKDQLIAYKYSKSHTVRVEIHRDPCLECGQPTNAGEVLVCDNCTGSYHMGCCGVTHVVKDGFVCSRCRGSTTKSRRIAQPPAITVAGSDDEHTHATPSSPVPEESEDYQRMHTLLQAAEQLNGTPTEKGPQPPVIVPKTGEILVACGPRSNPEQWLYASFHVHNCKVRFLVWDDARGWFEKIISPAEFERQAGRASSKKWRESIWVLGRDGRTPECNIGKYLDSVGKPRSNLPQPVGMGGTLDLGVASSSEPAQATRHSRLSKSPLPVLVQSSGPEDPASPLANATLFNLRRRNRLATDSPTAGMVPDLTAGTSRRKAASYSSSRAALNPPLKHSRSILSRGTAMECEPCCAIVGDENMSEASQSAFNEADTPLSTTSGSQLHAARGFMDEESDEAGLLLTSADVHVGGLPRIQPTDGVTCGEVHPGIFRQACSASKTCEGSTLQQVSVLQNATAGALGTAESVAVVMGDIQQPDPEERQPAKRVKVECCGVMQSTSCLAGVTAADLSTTGVDASCPVPTSCGNMDGARLTRMAMDETVLGEDIKKHLAKQIAFKQRSAALEAELEQVVRRAAAAEATVTGMVQKLEGMQEQLSQVLADKESQAKQLAERTAQMEDLHARLNAEQVQWAAERLLLQDGMKLAESKYLKAMQELLDIKDMLREGAAPAAESEGVLVEAA